MRGRTYQFEAENISTSHPFIIHTDDGDTSSISGTSGNIKFTISNTHSVTSGDLYYQCTNHQDMKANLGLLYKEVSETNETTASYDFYYGDVNVNVSGDFGDVSVYCYYHGYMGGENLLQYV